MPWQEVTDVAPMQEYLGGGPFYDRWISTHGTGTVSSLITRLELAAKVCGVQTCKLSCHLALAQITCPPAPPGNCTANQLG